MQHNLKKTVATNIQKYRKLKKLTQLQMCDYGFDYRHYQKIESGAVDLSLTTIERLAKIFGVPPHKLLK